MELRLEVEYMSKWRNAFKMTKKKVVGCIAVLSLLMVPCTALAGSATQNYVLDGVTVTVGATRNDFSGNGYGRYADTRKTMDLTVTFSYLDYDDVRQNRVGRAGGTTYVTATTPHGSRMVEGTKSTTSVVYIAGNYFDVTAR